LQELQYAMRRAGQNPTDIEVQDLINKIDNGSGTMDFEVINTISS
jgi:Ca2+-binding EF-hand superfamily protein